MGASRCRSQRLGLWNYNTNTHLGHMGHASTPGHQNRRRWCASYLAASNPSQCTIVRGVCWWQQQSFGRQPGSSPGPTEHCQHYLNQDKFLLFPVRTRHDTHATRAMLAEGGSWWNMGHQSHVNRSRFPARNDRLPAAPVANCGAVARRHENYDIDGSMTDCPTGGGQEGKVHSASSKI